MHACLSDFCMLFILLLLSLSHIGRVLFLSSEASILSFLFFVLLFVSFLLFLLCVAFIDRAYVRLRHGGRKEVLVFSESKGR